MKKVFEKMMVFSVLMLLLATLSGCGKKAEANASKNNMFIQADEAASEYKKTVSNLKFPEGFSIETPTFEEGDYQKGYGETAAYYTWQMAWEKEWLKTYKTEPEKGKLALEELDKALSYPHMSPEKCDDATRNFFKDALTKAKAGNPDGFLEDVNVNG